jgi:hypothetical protein
MASPFREGTLGCSAFSSKDIDILHESIHVKLNKEFSRANYVVEYTITSDSSGNQIPLLFYAKYYEAGFKVWLDGSPIQLLDIPPTYKDSANINLKGFSNIFEKPLENNELSSVKLASEWFVNTCSFSDLQYFKINLTKGKHIVRVEYEAYPGVELSGWISKHSFQYSLTPAKYWKSFHSLDVIIDATEFANKTIITSLGQPEKGKLDSISFFQFDKLPAELITISYQPEPNFLAGILIKIHPLGLSILLFIMLFYLHYKLLRKCILTKSEYSDWVYGIGIILIPLVVFIFFIVSFSLIDEVIGRYASGRHGYTFLIMILYPVFMPVYWLVMSYIKKDIVRVERVKEKFTNKAV